MLYLGEAQLVTSVGALPIAFEIEARSLGEAAEKFAAAAEVGVERTMRQLQEMRREAASSIVIPDRVPPGMGAGGGQGWVARATRRRQDPAALARGVTFPVASVPGNVTLLGSPGNYLES